jgi:hypothetical protein
MLLALSFLILLAGCSADPPGSGAPAESQSVEETVIESEWQEVDGVKYKIMTEHKTKQIVALIQDVSEENINKVIFKIIENDGTDSYITIVDTENYVEELTAKRVLSSATVAEFSPPDAFAENGKIIYWLGDREKSMQERHSGELKL